MKFDEFDEVHRGQGVIFVVIWEWRNPSEPRVKSTLSKSQTSFVSEGQHVCRPQAREDSNAFTPYFGHSSMEAIPKIDTYSFIILSEYSLKVIFHYN